MADSSNPFDDMFKAFRDLGGTNWPTFDPSSFTQGGGDAMNAMQEITRISSEAMQQMASRQQTMAAEAVSNWQKSVQEVMQGDPASMMQRATEVSREGADTATRNLSELSKIATEAQAQIMAVVSGNAKKSK
ncbi:MAG: phasin family protein [Alphaproteobacteria bacterium]